MQLCNEHHNLMHHLPPDSPILPNLDKPQISSDHLPGGGPNKLVNSNDKYNQRYKEIIKENDGKIFEVHQKKGSTGGPIISSGPAPLIR